MMTASTSPVVNLHPLSTISFRVKGPKKDQDDTRLLRIEQQYRQHGRRTTVEAIILVKEKKHPHALIFKTGNTFHKLPGGRLKTGENEIEGLKRKLSSKLAANSPDLQPNWQIGECVAIWWRPKFEDIMYPYCPPHITKPKECRKLFIVQLSESELFEVPTNLKLLAIPLFRLHNNFEIFDDPVLPRIPLHLSRFRFNMIDP